MKPCRFIFNSDYATMQNDAEIVLSVSIPSQFTVAANAQREFKASQDLPGSASKNYRCYFTSTAFNYAITGALACTLAFGSDYLSVAVERDKNKFTLNVFTSKQVSSHTFNGTAQTITVHIHTFVDPFQL